MSRLAAAIADAFQRRETLILDAALGAELERQGIATPAPLWSANALLSNPAAVRGIHREQALAGAEILTANTFRLNPRALRKADLASRASELIALAMRLAREAAESARVFIAPTSPLDLAPGPADVADPVAFVVASVAPAEDCYRPDLVPDDAALAEEHHRFAAQLAEAGADAAWIETMNTRREAAIAVRAARAAGLPCVVSFVPRQDGALLSGEPLIDAAREALDLGALAVGVNCAPPSALARLLRELSSLSAPLVAYGHLTACPTPGWEFCESASPAAYAIVADEWAKRGATIIGGCCGTTAKTLAALRRLFVPADRSRAGG